MSGGPVRTREGARRCQSRGAPRQFRDRGLSALPSGDELASLVPQGSTTVEVVLTPVGDETELLLRHSELPAGVAADEHSKGWALFVGDRLRRIDRTDWRTDPPVRVGSRIAFRARFLGRTLEYTYEVTDYVPGKRLTMTTAQGPFPMTTEYTWSALESSVAGDGRTLMTLRNHGRPTDRLLEADHAADVAGDDACNGAGPTSRQAATREALTGDADPQSPHDPRADRDQQPIAIAPSATACRGRQRSCQTVLLVAG